MNPVSLSDSLVFFHWRCVVSGALSDLIKRGRQSAVASDMRHENKSWLEVLLHCNTCAPIMFIVIYFYFYGMCMRNLCNLMYTFSFVTHCVSKTPVLYLQKLHSWRKKVADKNKNLLLFYKLPYLQCDKIVKSILLLPNYQMSCIYPRKHVLLLFPARGRR